ncbi:PaaI family thioesterase [Bacteroides sp. f07]|uniref:PaaI family thioesterase n=1 Tax=Bacteroides sp. f07 TaxID=3132704 RepID=UPI0034BE3214
MKKIINPWKGMEGYNCFGCASHNESGAKMEFYEDGDEVVSIWKPRPEYQGWIDTLHGGIQAVLLDEICAWAVLRKLQTTGVTSKMETRYRKPISTKDTHIVLRASIKEVKRNIVIIQAKLYNKDEEVCTEAVCTYFTFSKEKSKDEMHFTHCDVESEEILPLI